MFLDGNLSPKNLNMELINLGSGIESAHPVSSSQERSSSLLKIGKKQTFFKLFGIEDSTSYGERLSFQLRLRTPSSLWLW